MQLRPSRRDFSLGLLSALAVPAMSSPLHAVSYKGPNIILIRFGGGVRRQETIESATTYAPYLAHKLRKRGVLYSNMRIAKVEGNNTSHAEGTLNLLTGQYKAWHHTGKGRLFNLIEPVLPTLFEYLRADYNIPLDQVLSINGEDRPQEEYFSHAHHNQYGGDFKAGVLSLYRYKNWLYPKLLKEGQADAALLEEMQKFLQEHENHRLPGRTLASNATLDRFWQSWRDDFRDHGLVNQRGDRLLTQLALQAMDSLQPRLMMVNYQDTDYVHWGNASHYTRAISIIDDGIRQIVEKAEAHEHYQGRTIFVIVPDCGRDANSLMNIPYQHHFNTHSAREIWTLVFGQGIRRNKVIRREVNQTQVAATIGEMMNFKTPHAESQTLSEVFV